VFRLALLQAEGLIGSIITLLGLDLSARHHSAMTCWAERGDPEGRLAGAAAGEAASRGTAAERL
jgi:hypothetical protein